MNVVWEQGTILIFQNRLDSLFLPSCASFDSQGLDSELLSELFQAIDDS